MSYANFEDERRQAKERAQEFERQRALAGGVVSDFDPNALPPMGAPGEGNTPQPPIGPPGFGGEPPSAKDLGPVALPAVPPPPMELTAGYRNEYGTNVGVSYDPTRQDANVRAGFPIGDHQGGWNTSMRAGFNPEQGAYGMLSVGKRNIPQPEMPSSGEQDGALMQVLNRHPEALAEYRGLREQQRRAAVDRAMGVGVPGSEKFSFYAGINNTPDEDPRSRRSRMMPPAGGMGGLPAGLQGLSSLGAPLR